MKQTVICYKTIKPTIYNKGTRYESQCDEFLAYYASGDKAAAQAECDKLNAERPSKLWNGLPIDWKQIDHFFVDEQEAFEG